MLHLRIGTCALLHRVGGNTHAVSLINHMRPQLRQLLKFILEFFQILIIMPLLITICVLEQICVLVEVVLRKHTFGLNLVIVCLCSHLL